MTADQRCPDHRFPSDRFPSDGFLWGAAVSSHQVEGDNTRNDWWEWEQTPGRIVDGTTSGHAAGWWSGEAEHDLDRAAELGLNAIRMSLEWSRLEPEAGRFDRSAFDRYRAILRHARARGLTVLLTLHHFTLPRWVARLGGWTHPNLPPLFEGFAERAALELGDDVPLWATLNEPSVLAFTAYAGTRWPPGSGSVIAYGRALANLLDAHARGYRALHRTLDRPSVGLVVNMPRFEPARPVHPLDRITARAQDYAFNAVVVDGLATGRLLGARTVEGLEDSVDWIGLNFYGRFEVRFDPRAPATLFGRHVQQPTVRNEHTDWGQPSPAAMLAQLERLSAFGVPLYVTEHGVFDNDDVLRPRVLEEHLRALTDRRREGLDVRGYFHWSLVDNFEWAEGWSTRFGLFAVDPQTQVRTARRSAAVYARLVRELEV